jgi:hypothetical protein
VNLVTRVGGMLVAPRATLEALRAGAPGGLNDLMLLLVALLVAEQLPQLVRSLWFLFAVSYSGGISAFFNTVAQGILVPVVAIFVGALAINITTRGKARTERNVDLAALCAVPLIVLSVCMTLVFRLSGWRPPPWSLNLVMYGLGGIWYLALLVLAVTTARRGPPPAAEQEEAS